MRTIMQRRVAVWVALLGLVWAAAQPVQAQDGATRAHLVQPGDTWAALAAGAGLEADALREAHGHINRQREPTIGAVVTLPDAEPRPGKLARALTGGLLATAVAHQTSPWQLAILNAHPHPYRPLLYQPLFIPGGDAPPRDLPLGFTTLELAQTPANAGEALALRAVTEQPLTAVVQLNRLAWSGAAHERRFVALGGTGAFFGAGAPELSIRPVGRPDEPPPPAWTQPWLFVERAWSYEQITLTGAAAAITQEQIRAERERLVALWAHVTPQRLWPQRLWPQPLWAGPFVEPITNYVAVSSHYGARRSYNGGPYRSYHEGVDYAAYGGTAVTAPAAGRVALAEFLTVRGGAVILDHGLGVYSGYYHLSEINVTAAQMVRPGDLLGGVGTTGFSTGNHLHWDFLVNGTWVDAAAWLEQDLAGWIRAGLLPPPAGEQARETIE